MPGIRSSAATKCISDVPGLEKQVVTPLFSSECTRLSAPFIDWMSPLVACLFAWPRAALVRCRLRQVRICTRFIAPWPEYAVWIRFVRRHERRCRYHTVLHRGGRARHFGVSDTSSDISRVARQDAGSCHPLGHPLGRPLGTRTARR